MGLFSTAHMDMLRQEAQLLMTLRHPNILTMFHFHLNRNSVRTCRIRHGVNSRCAALVLLVMHFRGCCIEIFLTDVAWCAGDGRHRGEQTRLLDKSETVQDMFRCIAWQKLHNVQRSCCSIPG